MSLLNHIHLVLKEQIEKAQTVPVSLSLFVLFPLT